MDVQENEELRGKPAEDLVPIPLDPLDLEKVTYVGASLDKPLKGRMITFLQDNNDVFAWTTADMPGIDPNLITHRLNVDLTQKALDFPTTNNEVEYEVLIAGLGLARAVRAKNLKVYRDSRLALAQVNGEFESKDDIMAKYLTVVKGILTQFDEWYAKHVPREENTTADALSQFASSEIENYPRSVYFQVLKTPTIHVINLIAASGWIDPIKNYLETGWLPDDAQEARKLSVRVLRYSLIEGLFYKRVQRVLQRSIPFAMWGMDILGPFPLISGQRKFIVVAIDYFTKWIEAKALAKITTKQITQFFWENMICRYGIPCILVTDNTKQFDNAEFREYYNDNSIELRFTSVAHPQANG
ncbi:uncharacterized protein LOC141695686 [Apium graveolens]|uniref:uncharacterized protein LOC141695686 n=1 Tax=Apium graveolens TaxID=4045 RepID=UPI003D7A4C9E